MHNHGNEDGKSTKGDVFVFGYTNLIQLAFLAKNVVDCKWEAKADATENIVDTKSNKTRIALCCDVYCDAEFDAVAAATACCLVG